MSVTDVQFIEKENTSGILIYKKGKQINTLKGLLVISLLGNDFFTVLFTTVSTRSNVLIPKERRRKIRKGYRSASGRYDRSNRQRLSEICDWLILWPATPQRRGGAEESGAAVRIWWAAATAIRVASKAGVGAGRAGQYGASANDGSFQMLIARVEDGSARKKKKGVIKEEYTATHTQMLTNIYTCLTWGRIPFP